MRALTCVLVVVVLSACSTGEPEDVFYFVGSVTPSDGAAPDGAEVALLRSKAGECGPSFGDHEFPGLPGASEPLLTATTDPDGRFLFEPMRFQLAARAGRCFGVRTVGPTGARSELQFRTGEVDVQLPPLVLWERAPTQGMDGLHRPELPFAELNPPGTEVPFSPTYSPPPQAYFDWRLIADTGVFWRARATVEPLALSPRLLEDFAGARAEVEGLAQIRSAEGNVIVGRYQPDFNAWLTSAGVALTPAGEVPISRGAPCRVTGRQLDPCPATDGSLAPVAIEPPTELSTAPIFETDLGALRSLDELVVRGFEGLPLGFVVEGSTDGAAWATLGEVEAPPPPPMPEPGVPPATLTLGELGYEARFVRLSLVTPSGGVRYVRIVAPGAVIYGLAELSLFEAR